MVEYIVEDSEVTEDPGLPISKAASQFAYTKTNPSQDGHEFMYVGWKKAWMKKHRELYPHLYIRTKVNRKEKPTTILNITIDLPLSELKDRYHQYWNFKDDEGRDITKENLCEWIASIMKDRLYI